MKKKQITRIIYNFLTIHKIISVLIIAIIFSEIIASIFIPTVVLKDRKEEYKKISMFVEEKSDKICDLFEIINTESETDLTVDDMNLNIKNDNVRISYKYGTRLDGSIIYQYKDNKLVEISKDWNIIDFILFNIMIYLAIILFSAFLRYILEQLFYYFI